MVIRNQSAHFFLTFFCKERHKKIVGWTPPPTHTPEAGNLNSCCNCKKMYASDGNAKQSENSKDINATLVFMKVKLSAIFISYLCNMDVHSDFELFRSDYIRVYVHPYYIN